GDRHALAAAVPRAGRPLQHAGVLRGVRRHAGAGGRSVEPQAGPHVVNGAPVMPPSAPAEVRDLLALHLTPGVGPPPAAALLERFGSAAAVLRAPEARLLDVPHVGPKLAQALARAADNPEVNAELERVERAQVRLLLKGSPEYPASIA